MKDSAVHPPDAVLCECSLLAARRPTHAHQRKIVDRKRRFLDRLIGNIVRKVFDSQRIRKEVSVPSASARVGERY